MDSNVILALIALCAIVSPVIVSIVDNICKYNVKKIELKLPKQQEALSKFINIAMRHYCDTMFHEIVEYNSAKNNLYLFFNNVNEIDFDILEEHIKVKDLSAYKLAITEIAEKLSKQIDK